MQPRILIVDDHPLVRSAVHLLLVSNAMQVCGEAEDGRDCVEKVRELSPDIVILDMNMPVMNGIEAAFEIHRIAPLTKILFFTIHDSPEAAAAARLVADAFVPKAAAATDLVPALHRLTAPVN
jgi:two-component system, NarL family, nitrate/nitrite response regulator NarL